jgi:hypothetical protein
MNGRAETADQFPCVGAEGEPSPFAPKWSRDGRAQRKVVPLHLPAAPQLVPTASPADSVAATAPPRARPSGPELLAEDEVLKRLLQNASEPQSEPAKPVRDPVGTALGLVARLVVGGCGFAAVIMLVLGIIPSPLRLLPAPASDVAPVSTTSMKGDLAIQVADAGATADVIAAPVSTTPVSPPPVSTAGVGAADVAAAEPVRVPTVAVQAAPAGAGDKWALEPGEIERLVKRGEDYLAQGDIAAARLILGRAAEARDARAAFSLAATYDPSVLKSLHVVGFRPDVAQARAWYEKAVEYGSAEASRRLAALPGLSQ